MKFFHVAIFGIATFGLVSAMPMPFQSSDDLSIAQRDVDAMMYLIARVNGPTAEWIKPHKSTQFDAEYGITSSEKKGWAATHYAQVTPAGTLHGQPAVIVKAVPHGTAVERGSKAYKFGSGEQIH